MPSDIRNEESDTMVKLVEWNARIDVSPDEARDVAREVEEWLLEYLGYVFYDGFLPNRKRLSYDHSRGTVGRECMYRVIPNSTCRLH